jgi:hypothetical protein
MLHTKRITPQLMIKWKEFEKTAKQQAEELAKVKEGALRYRAYCDRTIDHLVSEYNKMAAGVQTCLDVLTTAQDQLRLAICENEYPVDLLPEAKCKKGGPTS